jgi:hypothetical protein
MLPRLAPAFLPKLRPFFACSAVEDDCILGRVLANAYSDTGRVRILSAKMHPE